MLYVLDEPTIGLHPRDNAALLKTLLKLRDHGNSLLIVEHDEDTIAAADHLIDLGPGAGRFGGEVVYQGKPPQRRPKPKSPLPKPNSLQLRPPCARCCIRSAIHSAAPAGRCPKPTRSSPSPAAPPTTCSNLTAAIPLGRLTVLTGISGSGKSTLMHQCLAVAAVYDRRTSDHRTSNRLAVDSKRAVPFTSAAGFAALKACYEVDQSPIGKTSRSCPATYVKVFDHIRALFAQLPEARMRGFDASRFSFNTEGGRCPECKGNGRVKLEMDFLPSTWVHCESCNGHRYNPATLEVTFRDKNIGEVLAMTIDEAAAFFESQPRIASPLQLMADTGLGYLQLGQALPHPLRRRGPAHQTRLRTHQGPLRSKPTLANRQFQTGNLYLIEEPTVGLHHEDIRRLIDILHRLVDEGHTVVVIEHHMAIAAEADWILDLGPEAGDGGGQIVAQGPPETSSPARKNPAPRRFCKPPCATLTDSAPTLRFQAEECRVVRHAEAQRQLPPGGGGRLRQGHRKGAVMDEVTTIIA